MRVGIESTHLHLVRMKKTVPSREKEGGDGQDNSWMEQVARSRHPFVLKQEAHSVKPDLARKPGMAGRVARLKHLREQIKAGTYLFNSRALAERILANETHLLEDHHYD